MWKHFPTSSCCKKSFANFYSALLNSCWITATISTSWEKNVAATDLNKQVSSCVYASLWCQQMFSFEFTPRIMILCIILLTFTGQISPLVSEIYTTEVSGCSGRCHSGATYLRKHHTSILQFHRQTVDYLGQPALPKPVSQSNSSAKPWRWVSRRLQQQRVGWRWRWRHW